MPSRSPRRQNERKERRRRATVAKLSAFALLAVFLAAASFVAVDALLTQGRIHYGVRALGCDLSRLSPEAARAELARAAAARLATPLVVTADAPFDFYLTVSPSECGCSLDLDQLLRQAEAVGREGGIVSRLLSRVRLLIRPVDLVPSVRWEEAPCAHLLDRIAVGVERVPRSASLTICPDGVKIEASEDGILVDRPEMLVRLTEAVARGLPKALVPLKRVPPAITTEGAMQAKAQAELFISGPVRLTYRDVEVEITADQLRSIAAYFPEGVAQGQPLTVDTDKGRELVASLVGQIEQPPVDAQIVPSADGKSYEVVPSVDGVQVDWEALLAAIDRAALETRQRVVAIPVRTWQPKLTTLDAELLFARHQVAAYTTYFSNANQARVSNIKRVASALDGRVVRAGETFSFNDAIGPRTPEAGYDVAPVISNGVLVPGVGGGICQVATTLFNAVLLAGLPVIERWPHTFFLERYPVGRDAAVSYGSQDLRFKNDTSGPLVINCTADDTSVEVAISALDLDRRVQLVTSPIRDIVSPSSSPAYPRVLVDPQLQPGQTSALEPGIEGRTVTVTRTVLDPHGRVLFTDEFTSVYKPKDWIVRVGQ